MLVLNNSSLLQVRKKMSLIDVLVTFSPSNIPYIFLNEYNFGIPTFTSKIDNKISNFMESNENIERKQMDKCNLSKLEHYDLKYVTNVK